MSDRRRNLFILLVVLGLMVASAVIVVTKSTRLGLDLQGGVQLVYEGRPTKQQPVVNAEGLDRALDIMRDRVDALGVSEPELQRSGENQIDVALPGVSNAERAERQVGTTAQLYFYDWEPNILDEDCRTNPEQVNGGQQPISGLYNAVKRASQCKGEVDANNTTDGDLYYAFDRQSKQPLNEGLPEENRDDLERQLEEAGQADNARDPQGPRGHRRPARPGRARTRAAARRGRQLVGAQGQPRPLGHGHQESGAGLRGGLRRPAQRHDGVHGQGARGLREDHPRDRAARRRQRGDQRRPAGPDRRLAPVRDPARQRADLHAVHQLPREPGRHRRRPGRADLRRLHDPDRAGPRAPAQDRRAAAAAGADLALAGLRHARPAGARPGPRGRPRRLRDRRALPDRLLPRARRDRGDRAGDLLALPVRADQAHPDHAHAAGHRRLDPHDRRRRRREHRHLRTGQGRGAPREIHPRGHRAGLQEGLRDDPRRQHRHAARRVHPVHPRHRGGQGLRVRAGHRHDGVAVHRRAGDSGDPAHDARLAHPQPPVGARRRQAAQADHVRLHGRLEVVLLHVGRDPAHLRAGDRLQGPELRDRLRVGHAHHRRAQRARDGRPGARRDRLRGLRRRQDPDAQERGAGRQRRPDRLRRVGPDERGDRRPAERVRARRAARTSRRSGRRSASPWPTPP